MSEETARELERLQGAETQQRAVVDDLKRECVESVAADIPDRLDAYAKRVAQDQPDAARALGPDGIRALRKELTDAANDLAAKLRESVEQITWPVKSRVQSSEIHSALYEFLYGQRVNRLTAVLKARGFKFYEGSGILPQDLYDRESFTELASELQRLAVAEQATATAKAADDRDAVDSLWADDE